MTAARSSGSHDPVAEVARLRARLAQRDAALADIEALAHIGSWVWEIADDSVRWSDELYRLFGVAPQSLEPRTYEVYLSFVHPDDRPRVDEALGRAFRTGEPFALEHRVLRADGTVRHIKAHGDVVLADDGHPVRMRGTAQDVTDRMRASVAAERGRAARVLDSIGEILFTTGPDWRVTSLNTRAVEQLTALGLRREEVEGSVLWEAVAALAGTSFHEAALRAVATGQEAEVEGYFPPLDRWFVARVVPSREGAVVYARDSAEQNVGEQRQRFLAEASRVLNGSLDYEVTLGIVARMALPSFADYCLVDVLLEDGRAERVEFAHADEVVQKALSVAALGYGPDPAWESHPISQALRTGKPVFLPTVDQVALTMIAQDADHAAYLGALAPVSLIAVPLTAQGTVLGALTFCLSFSGRRYTAADVALARELGDRAALAVQNARLYRAAQAEIVQRTQAEEALRKWAHIFEHAGWGVVMGDRELRTLLSMNPGVARMQGDTVDELVGQPIATPLTPESAAELPHHAQLAATSGRHIFEAVHRHRDGHTFPVLTDLTAVRDERGELLYFAANVQDLTERRRAEEQLRQAQKMDAVGRLAGGVAHDFNNMLMIIIGFTDFLLTSLPAGARPHADAEEIKKAAERASALTRQLLAFGRRQAHQPERLDLNAVVGDMQTMLRPLLGEAVRLVVVPAHPLAAIDADCGQLEQVLMNLALNACEAMPAGGRLTIETCLVTLGEGDGWRRMGVDLPAGPYVVLRVADTGHGMDAAVRAQIFEPFFSTKGSSANSGLGLAAVYGIVAQTGGYINVESEPGIGSVFSLYFPAAGALELDVAATPAPAVRGGTESVLVVEDEKAVRLLAARILTQQGYRVHAAADGREALAYLAAADTHVDLLVTDVVMPGLNGYALVERTRVARPDLPVLLMSGYTDNEAFRAHAGTGELPFLQKPFSPDSLALQVRTLLDARPSRSGPAD